MNTLIRSLNRPNEKVVRLLAAHDIKPTAQRVEVGQVVLDRPCHLSAEQILEAARQTGSKISKATVYNTLNLFVERGLLREVRVNPSRCFYDSTTSPHHHFYNVDTGELWDIQPDEVEFERLPRGPDGTTTDGIDVVIRVRNDG